MSLTRPVSHRSSKYKDINRIMNPKTGELDNRKRQQHHMDDLWHTAQNKIEKNPHLHIIAFTVDFSLGESRRLQKMKAPASEARDYIQRALGGVDNDLLLVLEENKDASSGDTLLHVHGYLITAKLNSADSITRSLRTAVATGKKIRLNRGVCCKDIHEGHPIDIGWAYYCTKDLAKKLTSCQYPDATRLAATQGLKSGARAFRKKLLDDHAAILELEGQANELSALVDSMLIGKDASNDNKHNDEHRKVS